MNWTDLTFTGSHILTASDMNRLQGNFSSMATGAAGAPPIAVNSLVVTGVASLSTVRAGAAYIGGNLAESQANKGVPNGYASLDGSGDVPDAQIPNLNASKVTSGTLNQARVPFEAPGPIGTTTPGTGKFTTVDITGAAPAPPAANRIYKDSVCKGWINFDGTAVTSAFSGVRDYFNVSGVLDEGTGLYRVYWDRDFANDDYAIGALAGHPGQFRCVNIRSGAANQAAGYVRLSLLYHDGAVKDADTVQLVAFGDQS